MCRYVGLAIEPKIGDMDANEIIGDSLLICTTNAIFTQVKLVYAKFVSLSLSLAPAKPTSFILIILTLKQFGVHEFVAFQQQLRTTRKKVPGIELVQCRQETGADELGLCGC